MLLRAYILTRSKGGVSPAFFVTKGADRMFKSDEKETCCCSGSSGCCGPGRSATRSEVAGKRRLDIEFLYLDVISALAARGPRIVWRRPSQRSPACIEATGAEVSVRKIHIADEEQARAHRFVSSPTIRVNGRDIQLDVRESLCESCGDLCGDDVDCRVWVYQGKEYTSPPKAMIVDAILRAVYGGPMKWQGMSPKTNTMSRPTYGGSLPRSVKGRTGATPR